MFFLNKCQGKKYFNPLCTLCNYNYHLCEDIVLIESSTQAGQYAEALELMEQRLNDELNSLGERSDEMADVYQNMARCKSEVVIFFVVKVDSSLTRLQCLPSERDILVVKSF